MEENEEVWFLTDSNELKTIDEIKKLRQQNAELLETLKKIDEVSLQGLIRVSIAKATGGE